MNGRGDVFASRFKDKIGWEQWLSEDVKAASQLWQALTLFPKFKDTELPSLSPTKLGLFFFFGVPALWLTCCVDTGTLFLSILFTRP